MTGSEERVLLIHDSAGVRTLTLNRPHRKNAIDAAEAHSLGLVTWVTSADEIDGFVDDLAGRLAAGPPFALAQSKALLNDGANSTLPQALANEARAQPGNFATADSGEAYAAFASKREPEFTGEWAVPRSEQKNA